MVISKYAGLVAAALVLSLVAVSGAAGNGSPIVVASFPDRIVSLSPTATEDLFAIGAGSQVVAVDKDSDYPANAPHTSLDAYQPNAEAIAMYNPDLVVISNDEDGIIEALGVLHIRVQLEPAVANLDGVYAQINQLGEVTGHAGSAKALVAKMRSQVTAIVHGLPHPAKPLSVYHELGTDYFSVTSKTFIGRVYTMLGLHDIADAAKKAGSGYPQLSAEYIVASDPDLIVLADTVCCGQTPATVAKRPGWEHVWAVEHGGVLAVNDDIASRWGPRIVDFIRQVAAKVKAIETK